MAGAGRADKRGRRIFARRLVPPQARPGLTRTGSGA